jgi:hypothetical protein
MKVAHSLFAVLLATVLTGCADYQAQQQAQQQQQKRAQLEEQAKTAAQDCANKFPLAPQTLVARVQCVNTAWAPVLPALGGNADLFQTFMAQRLAIAEQVQSGKITMAEGNAAASQKYSEMLSAAQRRVAIAQTAAAQQQTLAAQQRAAEAAKAAADWQAFGQTLAAANLAYAAGFQQSTVRLETTCMQIGNVTDCY